MRVLFVGTMRRFELELLLQEHIGKDCCSVVFLFLEVTPCPYDPFALLHEPSPWSNLAELPDDGINLPLFAP